MNDEDFTRLEEDRPLRHAHHGHRVRPRSAWWIYAYHLGRVVILGPYSDQVEAERDCWSKTGGKGEVLELPTIDRTKARDMAKKKILDKAHDLDIAFKRARYKVDSVN